MDKNSFKYTHFNFMCKNKDCEVSKFTIDFSVNEEPPEFWPEDNQACPCCGMNNSTVVGGSLSGYIKTRGGTRKGDHSEADSGYAKQWYEDEIKNTKEALEFKKGISPYSKYKMDYKEMERLGKLKKVSQREARERVKRSEKVAQSAEKFIDDDHKNRIGDRPNG